MKTRNVMALTLSAVMVAGCGRSGSGEFFRGIRGTDDVVQDGYAEGQYLG